MFCSDLDDEDFFAFVDEASEAVSSCTVKLVADERSSSSIAEPPANSEAISDVSKQCLNTDKVENEYTKLSKPQSCPPLESPPSGTCLPKSIIYLRQKYARTDDSSSKDSTESTKNLESTCCDESNLGSMAAQSSTGCSPTGTAGSEQSMDRSPESSLITATVDGPTALSKEVFIPMTKSATGPITSVDLIVESTSSIVPAVLNNQEHIEMAPRRAQNVCSNDVPTKKKRKFPGPAGKLPPLRNEGEIRTIRGNYLEKDPAPVLSSVSSQVDQSQKVHDIVNSDPWQQMLEELDLSQSDLEKHNVANTIKLAKANMLPGLRAPFLSLFVESLTESISDTTLILKDVSGEITGAAHSQVLKDFHSVLTPGCVIVLKQVAVFSPGGQKHILNITPKNLLRVYPADTVADRPPLSVDDSLRRLISSPIVPTPVTRRSLALAPANQNVDHADLFNQSNIQSPVIRGQTFNSYRTPVPSRANTGPRPYTPRPVQSPMSNVNPSHQPRQRAVFNGSTTPQGGRRPRPVQASPHLVQPPPHQVRPSLHQGRNPQIQPNCSSYQKDQSSSLTSLTSTPIRRVRLATNSSNAQGRTSVNSAANIPTTSQSSSSSLTHGAHSESVNVASSACPVVINSSVSISSSSSNSNTTSNSIGQKKQFTFQRKDPVRPPISNTNSSVTSTAISAGWEDDDWDDLDLDL